MKKILIVLLLLTTSYSLLTTRLFADQNLTLTAVVSPKPSDYSIGITSDTTGTLSQSKTLTYTITYGGSAGTGVVATTTIVADFSDDSPDSGNTSVLDYVSGSATNAVYATPPIIDLVHQKITWTIANFNSSLTNKTVSFALKTNTNYTGSSSVPFILKASLYNTYVTLPSVSTTNTYLYDASLNTTPTPTPTGSSSSSSSTTSSSTPTPSPVPTILPTGTATTKKTTTVPVVSPTPIPPKTPSQQPAVANVSVIDLSQNSTQVALTVPPKSTAIVTYGTSPTSLTSQDHIDTNGENGLISLDQLQPQTTYYMQVVTTSSSGKVTKSDIFSLQTAQVSNQPQVSTASVVFATDNDVLYSAGLNNQATKPGDSLTKTPQIPIAQDTSYSLAFKLTKAEKIKTVTMIMKNTSVLGISNFAPPPTPLEFSFPVNATGNGTYGVQIKNPTVAGTYDAFIRIVDFDGNITTQRIAQIKSLKPFRMYNARTKSPIEDGRILIFRFNPDTKKYDLLPNRGGISNPLYTNSKGEASESLPKGRYKANFGRIGYVGQDNVQFSIGTTPRDDFPTVYLKPTPITPLAIFIYYRNAFTDYVGTTAQYIAAIQQSYRYFDLVGLGVIFCFVVISLLLFRMKSHIAFSHMPYYLHHHTSMLFGKKTSYLSGSIFDKTSRAPIAGATVFAIEETTEKVVGQITTNKAGGFLLPFDKTKHYALSVMKQGYEPSGLVGYTPNIRISLEAGETTGKKVVDLVTETTENAFGLFFEFMLVLSLLMEVLLFPAFGLWKTVPFLAASLLNVILWAFYLRERGKQLSVN